MRVLIVDDDPDCRQIVALMLSKENWTLAFAATGVDALATAREFRPDLVLMDILMPTMTGLEVALAMREDERFRGVTLIALTALAFETDRQQALAAGFDAVITKPFGRRLLRETIYRHFPELRQPDVRQVPA